MPRFSQRRRHHLLALASIVVGSVLVPPASGLAEGIASPPAPDAAGPLLDALADLADFRLVVPFRTQKDGGRWQTSNCGPATLGMLLDVFGPPEQATDDLRVQMHTYQGTLGMRTGTGLEHVAHVAEDYGLAAHGLYAADGGYRRWDVEDIAAELRRGRPVMPLVRLYLVPGYENLAPRWGHYILLTGIGPGGFYFSDSLKTDPAAGTSGVILPRQLASAMENSHIPGQAVAFSGPAPLPVRTPGR